MAEIIDVVTGGARTMGSRILLPNGTGQGFCDNPVR